MAKMNSFWKMWNLWFLIIYLLFKEKLFEST